MENGLYRCFHCKAIHTYEMISQMGRCRKCRSRRFSNALHVEDEEIPVLDRAGYDWKAEGWVQADDTQDAVQ